MRRLIRRCGLLVLMGLALPCPAQTTVTPFAGFRFGDGIMLRTSGTTTTDELRIRAGRSEGILLNVDLDTPARRFQLYYSHQDTRANVSQPAEFGGIEQFDLSIDRLQAGGLYFPDGQPRGWFVDGTLGVTRLTPHAAGLETDYYPSIALGTGTQMPLGRHLSLRFDLRGIYTALNTGGAIFCSGGCTARVDSSGFFQVETAVGVGFRF